MQNGQTPKPVPTPTPFVDVREPHTNKLLFRYDPVRNLVEIQDRSVKTLVDLTQYGVKKQNE